MVEWLILGAIIGCAALTYFWNDIRNWLNSVAADVVERHLGYSARERMQKAVAFVDKYISKVRNKAIIYTRKPNSVMFDKTTIISEASVYDIEQDVLDEIERKGTLVQEFSYGK